MCTVKLEIIIIIIIIITRTLNRSVQRVLDGCEKSAKKPRKERTVYSDTDRAAIGKYAAENGNTSARKHFKEKFPALGESTVRSFKQKYIPVSGSRRQEQHCQYPNQPNFNLALGDLDQEVQKYIRALRAAGTAISVPLVLAAAQGIIEVKDRTWQRKTLLLTWQRKKTNSQTVLYYCNTSTRI